MPLAVTVLVTLLVYWAAGGYAELLGEPATAVVCRAGRTRPGATTQNAATVALVVAIALLVAHGWAAGRASRLHGLRLLA